MSRLTGHDTWLDRTATPLWQAPIRLGRSTITSLKAASQNERDDQLYMTLVTIQVIMSALVQRVLC